MPRTTGPQTIQSLLDASQAIIVERGIGKLTLDAVVERAKLSKGALLHHFKSKDDLARRLMQDAIEQFDALVLQIRADDRTPGSYTRAYVKATLQPPRGTNANKSFQVISALARDPSLKQLLVQSVRHWSQQVENDGLDPVVAELVRLAADGLWWHESSDCAPVDARIRRRLATLMLGMTE